MDRIIALLKRDPIRVDALNYVFQMQLPECYIAAGFVRNLVWDALHDFESNTPLNDVDVIYFDPDEANPDTYLEYEAYLKSCMPTLNWKVRNQAQMHLRNGDTPYLSSEHAMSHWPEKETAVGVRKTGVNQYEVISAFGFNSLFGCCITHNPKRSQDIFENRLQSKAWLSRWPALKVVR